MELKIAKGEYLNANVYILIKGNEVVIIDSGAPIEDVKALVGERKVVGILLTHAHFDHSLHAIEYGKFFNTKIYLNELGKEVAENTEKNYGEGFVINDFSCFEFLKGNGNMKLGNFEFSYFHTPGHCTDCNCYLFGNILFAGDTLFEDSVGNVNLIGSDKRSMVKSLKLLDTLEFEKVYSGHGEASDFERQKRNIKVHLRFLQR